MLHTKDIIEALLAISPYSEETLDSYILLIEAEKAEAEALLADAGAACEKKAVLLAAARVNYKITLLQQDAAVTAFKAGDVSITERTAAAENAKAFLEEVTKDCGALVGKSDFVFKTV